MTDEEKRKRLRYLQLKAKAAVAMAPASEPPTIDLETPSDVAPSAAPEPEPLASGPNLPATTAGGAFTRGVANTYGTGDLIGAGMQTLGEGLRSIASGESPLLGYDANRNQQLLNTFKSAYRGNRRLSNADAEQHLLPSIGGSVFGGVLAGPALSAGGGVLRTMAAGGGFGALGRAASSDSESLGGRMLDAGIGAVTGVGGSALGYGLGKMATPALRYLGGKLKDIGLAQGRRVLNGGADLSSATKRPVSDEAVEEALRSRAIVPMGTTQGTAGRLETLTSKRSEHYNQLLKELQARGVPGAKASEVVDTLIERAAQEELTTSADKSVPRAFVREAQNLENLALGEENLPLLRAEEIKRKLQTAARNEYSRLTGSSEMGDAKVEIARVLREANEAAVERAGKAAPANDPVKELAASFRPVKAELGRTLQANEAAMKGASKAASRNALGLPERMAIISSFASGGPSAALGAAGGAGLLRSLLNRGSSTVASSAYWGGRAANPLAALLGQTGALGSAGGVMGRRAMGTEDGATLRALYEYLSRRSSE